MPEMLETLVAEETLTAAEMTALAKTPRAPGAKQGKHRVINNHRKITARAAKENNWNNKGRQHEQIRQFPNS
jgi:hypothetical protein